MDIFSVKKLYIKKKLVFFNCRVNIFIYNSLRIQQCFPLNNIVVVVTPSPKMISASKKFSKDEAKVICEYHNCLDRGYSWVVYFAAYIATICSLLPLFSFGVLYSPLLTEVSTKTVSWIFNINRFFANLSSLFVGPLTTAFGWRKVAAMGCFLTAFSTTASAFMQNPLVLFVTFSVMQGIGGSLTLATCLYILSNYFEKYKTFAFGAVSLGMATSQFIGPLMIKYLFKEYGFIGGTTIFGAVLFNGCAASLLFHPTKWHRQIEIKSTLEVSELAEMQYLQNEENNFYKQNNSITYKDKDKEIPNINSNLSLNLKTLSILKEKSNSVTNVIMQIFKDSYNNFKMLKVKKILLITIGNSFMLTAYLNFVMLVPFFLHNLKFSLKEIAWTLSLGGIGNGTIRILIASLADQNWFSRRHAHLLGFLITAAALIAIGLVTTLLGLRISIVVWAIGKGTVMALYTIRLVDVMGKELLPETFGVSCVVIAFSFIIFGPIIGWLRDLTESYSICIFLLAACEILAFTCWLLIPWVKGIESKQKEDKVLDA